MIIELTVANFRSIREKQTFSLYAESSSRHLANNIAFPGEGKFGVLRTAGVYGANASGKSNLLLAFDALKYMICKSGDLKENDKIPCYQPFRLSESTKNAPIEFEVEFFSDDNIRFIYSVSFNATRIITESLDFYPSRSKANIFNRNDEDTWKDVTFGSLYKGGKKKFAFFDNNTYISKSSSNADSPQMIRSIVDYFGRKVFHLGVNDELTVIAWKDNKKLVTSVASILSKVDTGIYHINFRKNDISRIILPEQTPEHIKKRILDDHSTETLFEHRGDHGHEEEFTEAMESSGTIKLFKFLPVLLELFHNGGVLFMDELDNSFHPHIAELIIKLFNDPSLNKNNAQLIFSTHDINLMTPEILRRDQIWLTEKKAGETLFSSLDEFDKKLVKIDSPFRNWYGQGRFGAIPSIDYGAISKIIADRISNA